MTTSNTSQSVSRRTALAGLGAGTLGVALAATVRHASAQDTATEMAKHPIVGTWMAVIRPAPGAPGFASPAIFAADGSQVIAWPITRAGPDGVTFGSGWVGAWEPISERGIHFTAVQVLSDAAGAYLGTVTVDGYPVVSEDGQTFLDDSPQTTNTIRDPLGTIVQQFSGGGGAVTGTRIRVGSDGLPQGTPTPATPTS
jgi:hypothetical protein